MIIVVVLVAIVVLVVLYLIFTYNSMVRMRNRVDQACPRSTSSSGCATTCSPTSSRP